jgi:hypothetical protein
MLNILGMSIVKNLLTGVDIFGHGLTTVLRALTGYGFPGLARCAWQAYQPGHQPVCQRHSRAIKDLGLASAFFLMGQVSQAKVFSDEDVLLIFITDFFHDGDFLISI